MKALKIIRGLIRLSKKIYGVYKHEKDTKKRHDIKQAIDEKDLDKLNKLMLGRK